MTLSSPKSNLDFVENSDLNNNFKDIPIKFPFQLWNFLFRIWYSCLDSNIQQIGYDHWGWLQTKEISSQDGQQFHKHRKNIKIWYRVDVKNNVAWDVNLWKVDWTALSFVLVKKVVTKTRHFLLFMNKHSHGLLKKSLWLSYLTVVLFCCKCILFAGAFQKNLFTDRSDESIKLTCTV